MRTDTMLHFKGGGTAASGIFCAVFTVLALLVSAPGDASAASLAGSSNTYIQGRQEPDGKRLVPLFEYLDFKAQDVAGEAVSAHFGGWYRYDINQQTTNNDVQYGYLSFKSKTANSMFNLGRVLVAEGVAAERVDGAYARTDLMGNIGISAFGGSPVETEIDLPGNNVIYGGRLSHQYPGVYRIGISALKEEKNKEDFRKEEGVDLWLRPFNGVELLGKSNYNAITKEWMQHSYVLVLGPFANLRLNTTASAINYKSFFTGATNAAFFFQPGVSLDPNEKVKILGEEVSYGITSKLNISADYQAFNYEIAGDAKKFGGNIRYSYGTSGGSGISIHRTQGDSDLLKYNEYRLYTYRKLGKADITLDALDVKYDAKRNNITHAYSLSLAAAYEVKERLKVGADVEYAKNPDFNKDVRGLIKLNYQFDFGYGKRKEGA